MVTQRTGWLIAILLTLILALASCTMVITPEPSGVGPAAATPAAEEEATAEPAEEGAAWSAPEGALVSIPVDAAPTLDGVADEAVWAEAPEIVIPVAKGANTRNTEVRLKSVYVDDMIYFLATWADPTESYIRSPWVKQADGSWAMLVDPNDRGGDNNLYYEDKFPSSGTLPIAFPTSRVMVVTVPAM